ncbi:ppp1r36 [Pungitius sinensis]
MAENPEEPTNVGAPPCGRWLWRDDTRTLEFVRLAEIYTVNHRGRQHIRKGLSPAHLHAYRSSVMRRQGDRITTDDVKQVAVSLLQENHTLPIPVRFLAVLKSKGLDEVLTALLLYLCCFFEHKSLENAPDSFTAIVDIIPDQKMIAQALAKKEIAQKKLAVCYFSLIMDLEIEQHQHTYHKGRLSSNSTEWLLHACLYSFICYVAWVTFGRRDLKDIQEEVGRLLYSDTINIAARTGSDGDLTTTFTAVDGTETAGVAEPKEAGCKRTLNHRTSQRRPVLSGTVNQRSPLMVSLLPSPKERSPHLFPGNRAGKQNTLQPEHHDTKALTEELQQLASVSVGVLGKPFGQFSRSTLIPSGDQNKQREDDDHEPDGDIKDSEDHAGIHV